MLPIFEWLVFPSWPIKSRNYSKWVKSVNFNKHCLGRSISKVCSGLDDPFSAEDDLFVNVGVAVRSRFKHVFAVCGRDRDFFIGWKIVATMLGDRFEVELGRLGQIGSSSDKSGQSLSKLMKTWIKWAGTYRVIKSISMTGSQISNHFRRSLLNSLQFFFKTIHMIWLFLELSKCTLAWRIIYDSHSFFRESAGPIYFLNNQFDFFLANVPWLFRSLLPLAQCGGHPVLTHLALSYLLLNLRDVCEIAWVWKEERQRGCIERLHFSQQRIKYNSGGMYLMMFGLSLDELNWFWKCLA